jgi:predicted transcriptional regulator
MKERAEHRSASLVSDYMRTNPAKVDYGASLMDALRVMSGQGTSTVLVMSGDDVEGVIGADDIGRLVAKGVDLNVAKVREFVAACLLTGNQPCVQIRERDTVLNALKVMDNWTASQIIVVNGENKVVGTITALDALKGWMEEVSRP